MDRKYIHLTEKSLKPGYAGDARFDPRNHYDVTSSHQAGADVITVTINGECRIWKNKNGPAYPETIDNCQIRIIPTPNGGFIILKHAPLLGDLGEVLAAVSSLPEMLAAVGSFYCREAVATDEAVSSDGYSDAAEAAAMVAEPAVTSPTTVYIVASGTEDEPEKTVTVYYDEDVAKRVTESIWQAGGRARFQPARYV